MSAELFNELPFNLAGEELREEIDAEGERRLDAENKANERKAQKVLFCPTATNPRENVTLTSGRVIVHSLQPNGSQLAYMADGGQMSDDEWTEYCGRISTRAIRWPKFGQDWR